MKDEIVDITDLIGDPETWKMEMKERRKDEINLFLPGKWLDSFTEEEVVRANTLSIHITEDLVNGTPEYLQLLNPALRDNFKSVMIDSGVGAPSERKALDISFLKDYETIEHMMLRGIIITDLEPLRSSKIRKTLKHLYIANSNIPSLDVFHDYSSIETVILELNGVEKIGTIPSNMFCGTLDELVIEQAMGNLDYSFLEHLKVLKTLAVHLRGYEGGFEAFGKGILPGVLKHLYMDYGKNINISFLQHYKSLKSLNLSKSSTEDLSPLKDSHLRWVLEELRLGNDYLKDLSVLYGYEKIEELDIRKAILQDIDDLMDCEFVRNRTLESIDLPESINWNKRVGDRYVNREVVEELKRRGVGVQFPEFKLEPPRIEPKPKLYILVAPTAGGKSTIIQQMMEGHGVKPFKKITTRGYRSEQEKTFMTNVAMPEFEEKFKQGKIYAAREAFGHQYGIDYDDLVMAYASKDKYMLDSTDIISAIEMQEVFQDFVEIILMLTPLNLIEKGLIQRDMKFVKEGNEEQHKETMRRFSQFEEQYRVLKAYSMYVKTENIIDTMNYEEQRKQVRKIVCGER